MGRTLISLTALFAAASALQPAAAQTPPGPWAANVVGPVPDVAPAPIGFVVAPGVTFVPSAFSEIGYDSNPSQSFTNSSGSAFIRSGGGFALSSVTQSTVVNVNTTGSMMDYFNDSVFYDSLRFAGIANANVSYLVQPGLTVSSGAFINYDGQSVNKNQTDGANVELGYRDGLVLSVLRARFLDVQYLNGDVIASPIALTSAFNYNRSELTWIGLLGSNWFVAPYTEVSGARVDYTDQPNPDLLDRSADDYHAKAGLRVTFSPTLFSDVGWRFNWRDTDDHRITNYESNFFDGSLTWRPAPFFNFTASAERYIGEPATPLAVLADVRAYTVKGTYLPVPGVTVTAAGGWQVVEDIGSGVHYHAPYASAQVAWDYNNHVTLYTAVQYQGYNLDWQYLGYNDLRVMTGIRIIPDGQDLLNGESLDSLIARLGDARRPIGSELTVSGGYSWFGLPDMKNVTIVGGPLFNQAIGQETTGDGNLNGWRTDVGLANFAGAATPFGNLLSFGVSGFFANYQGTTSSHCMYSLTTDCAIVNIADVNPSLPNNTGPFGNLNVTTNRDVNYYGAAVDARLGWWVGGGYKDEGPVQELSPFRVGVAMRGLDETANMTSIDPLVCDPAKYKEILNAHYYGGYVGVERKEAFGDGWMIGIDATAGIYYTDTEYQGRYNGYTAILPVGYFQDSGYVNGSQEKGSFIGTVRLDLKRQLGWGTVGVFGQGEYLSYVPRIAYNNNDQANGVPWGGLAGNQNGTRIASSDAFNFTTGLSVSVPVN
ncbi:MAG: outer membrane beta-barrel protein [Rhodomicrobium sp.]